MAVLTKAEYEAALRRMALRGSSPVAPPEPNANLANDEDAGFFTKAIDILNRPNSAIMGAASGTSIDDAIARGVEGFTGEKAYSGSDVLQRFGAPDDSWGTSIGGFALDVLNPLDPLNYLSFGLNKAGRVAQAGGRTVSALDNMARAAAMGGRVAEGTKLPGKLLDSGAVGIDRVTAAERGLWNGVNFAGRGLLPDAVNVPYAKVQQAIGNTISQSKPAQGLRDLFGGVRNLRPELTEAIRDLRYARTLGTEENDAFLTEIVKKYDPETRKLATLAIEDPALFKQMASGQDTTIQVPDPKDVGSYLENQKKTAALGTARHDMQRAHTAAFESELGSVEKAVDGWQQDGRLVLQDISELDSPDIISKQLEDVFNRPHEVDVFAKHHPGGRVLGLISGSNIPGVEGIVKKGKRVPTEAERALGAFKKQSGDTGFSFGKEFPDELDPGIVREPVYAIIETRQDLMPDLQKIGGAGRGLEERKATVNRVLEGVKDFIAKGGNTMGRDALKKHLASKFGIPKKHATVDAILESIDTRIMSGVGKGVYTTFDDGFVEWARQTDAYAAWRAEDALLNAGGLQGPELVAARWKRSQQRLHGEISHLEGALEAVTANLPRLSMSDGRKTATLPDKEIARLLGEEGFDSKEVNAILSGKASPHDVVMARMDAKRISSLAEATQMTDRADILLQSRNLTGMPMDADDVARRVGLLEERATNLEARKFFMDATGDEAEEIDRLIEAIQVERANVIGNKWTPADAAHTNSLFSDYDIVNESKIAAMVERLDRLKEIRDNPDVFEQAAATLADIEAQGLDKWKMPTKPLQIRDAAVVASPGVDDLVSQIKPINARIEDTYRSRGVPEEALPFGDKYMLHMLPRQMAGLFGKAKTALSVKTQNLKDELTSRYIDMAVKAGKTPDPSWIEAQVSKDIKQVLGVEVIHTGKEAGRGALDSMKHRKLGGSAYVLEKADIATFEQDAAILVSEMYRNASQWGYGFDLYKFAGERFGKTGEELRAMFGEKIPGNWAAVKYNVYGAVDSKTGKAVFEDLYIPADVERQLQTALVGVNALTTDKGIRGMLETAAKFRNWFSATTLAPWPSFHVRNLFSDMVLNAIGGLSPVAKDGSGVMAYTRAFDFLFKSGDNSFDGFVGELRQAFNGRGDVNGLSKPLIEEFMKKENILGSAPRDIEQMLTEKLTELGIPLGGGVVKRTARNLNPLSQNNFFVRKGRQVGQKVQDFTHSALFFDRLRWHSMNTNIPLEQAMKESAAHVRKHLFDYADLTEFERLGMRNLVPFYTFSSKNIPLMLETMAKDPGKMAYLHRAYSGLWAQNPEVEHEDVPKWIGDALGAPIRKRKGENGEIIYSMLAPMGWIPVADINEMAGLFREGGFSRSIIAKLNPVAKEAYEQAMNRDAYTSEAISDGRVKEVFGIVMPARVAHLLRNLRFVTEIDRLNPFGIFTGIGKKMGWWVEERPNKREAAGAERLTRFMTGASFFDAAPEKEAKFKLSQNEKAIGLAKWNMRNSRKKGQTYESEQYAQEVMKLREERTVILRGRARAQQYRGAQQ